MRLLNKLSVAGQELVLNVDQATRDYFQKYGSEGQKDREVTAAGNPSLQLGVAPSMHVPTECESTAEHERKSQHRERDGFCKRNGEEKGWQRKAVGSEVGKIEK